MDQGLCDHGARQRREEQAKRDDAFHNVSPFDVLVLPVSRHSALTVHPCQGISEVIYGEFWGSYDIGVMSSPQLRAAARASASMARMLRTASSGAYGTGSPASTAAAKDSAIRRY